MKEQGTISSLPESLDKEYNVFSHLCSSFAGCSGSKFKGRRDTRDFISEHGVVQHKQEKFQWNFASLFLISTAGINNGWTTSCFIAECKQMIHLFYICVYIYIF